MWFLFHACIYIQPHPLTDQESRKKYWFYICKHYVKAADSDFLSTDYRNTGYLFNQKHNIYASHNLFLLWPYLLIAQLKKTNNDLFILSYLPVVRFCPLTAKESRNGNHLPFIYIHFSIFTEGNRSSFICIYYAILALSTVH